MIGYIVILIGIILAVYAIYMYFYGGAPAAPAAARPASTKKVHFPDPPTGPPAAPREIAFLNRVDLIESEEAWDLALRDITELGYTDPVLVCPADYVAPKGATFTVPAEPWRMVEIDEGAFVVNPA